MCTANSWTTTKEFFRKRNITDMLKDIPLAREEELPVH
jgi:hypothetical protein